MPYPCPDDPDYCPGSRQPVPAGQNGWFRCPECARLIAPMPNGLFYPHLLNPARARGRGLTAEILLDSGYVRDRHVGRGPQAAPLE